MRITRSLSTGWIAAGLVLLGVAACVSLRPRGPLVLDIEFPAQPAHDEEPILVTGSVHKADYLSVRYGPRGSATVRFVFISDDAGGMQSNPVSAGPGPHRVVIDSPSLYRRGERTLWRDVPSDRLRISVDGRVVVSQRVSYFLSSPRNWHVGTNPLEEWSKLALLGAPSSSATDWVRLGGTERFSGKITAIPDAPELARPAPPYFRKVIFVATQWAWIWLGLALLASILAHDRAARRTDARRRRSWDLTAAALVFLGAVPLIGFLSSHGQPYPLGRNLSEDREYYAMLGRSFLTGHTTLPVTPNPKLLALADPYDPRQNSALRLADAVLYHGRYYLYHSPIPAVLANIPWRLLTGWDLPESLATAIFSLAAIGAALLTLVVARRAWSADSSPVAFVLALGGLAFSTPFLFVVSRPLFYEQAICAANAFLMMGCLGLALGLAQPARRTFGGIVAAAGFALAIGTRPNLFIASPAMGLGLLFLAQRPAVAGAPSPARKFDFRLLAAFAIPFAIVGIPICAYNWSRFGSPFEFGVRWQLWGGVWGDHGPTRNHPIFSLRYLLANLQLDILRPPHLIPVFPYLKAAADNPAGLSPSEGVEGIVGFPYFMPVFLVALALALTLGAGRRPQAPSGVRRLILVISAIGAVVGVSSLFCSGANMRYLIDFEPALALAGAIAFLQVCAAPARRAVRIVGLAGAALATAGSALMALDVSLMAYNRLPEENPELYRAMELRLTPDAGAAQSRLAEALLRQKKWGAVDAFTDLAILEPGDAAVQNRVGEVLTYVDKPRDALPHLEEAVRLRPDFAEAQDNLGYLLMSIGRLPEALGHLEAAVREEPAVARAQNNLGVALADSGRMAESVAPFQAAVRLQPRDIQMRTNLTAVLTIADRPAEAIPEFEQLVGLAPLNPVIRRNFARALRALRRDREADAQDREAARLEAAAR